MENTTIEKLVGLIQTGKKENITLAFKLAKSQKIDLERYYHEKFPTFFEYSIYSVTERSMNKLFQEDMLFYPHTEWKEQENDQIPQLLLNEICDLALPNLEDFSIQGELTHIPQSICKLSALSELTLSHSTLTEFPVDLVRELTKTKSFGLYLTGTPIIDENKEALEDLADELGDDVFYPTFEDEYYDESCE